MRIVALLLVATLAGCVSDPEDPQNTAGTKLDENASVWVYNSTLSAKPGDLSNATLLLDNLTFGSPVSYLTGFRGPEPNIGITGEGNVFLSAMSNVLRSADQGANWTVVQTHQLTNNDPMLWVDQWTNTVYNAPMFPILTGASIYMSADEGNTWNQVPFQNMGRTVYDHQKLASGPPGPDAPPVAGLVHPTVLYMCYNGIATTNCAISYDGGMTWPHDIPTTTNAETGAPVGSNCFAGQNGHPTVSPDGVVAIARTWTCGRPMVTISTDSGLTWTTRAGPADPSPQSLDPEIAFTDDGTMYMLYQANDHTKHLARSDDLGMTWAGPWVVSPPHVNSTSFDVLAAGDEGKIAIAFHGTNATGNPSNVANDAMWYTYIVTSTNANETDPTFTAYVAQPWSDPVQVGPIWQGGGDTPSRNLLDFIDGAIHPDGSFFVGYADGCIGSCVEAPAASASRSAEAAVAHLQGFQLRSEA